MRWHAGLLVLLAISLWPTAQAVADPVGSGTLVVGAGKWRALEQRGIGLVGTGAADSEGRRTRLQVSGGTIATGSARLSAGGALRLSAGEGRSRRAVKLTALRVDLGPISTLSAKAGKKRQVLFDLRASTGGPQIDPARGAAQLRGADLVWRAGTAKALSKRLGVKVPRGKFGSFEIAVATVLADNPPQSGPISDEPPLLARPASAVNITTATLAWHVRDSWIRYLNTQEAPQVFDGATAQAPIQENNHPCPNSPSGTNPTLVYSYDYPFANGWYDPASRTAALYYGGGVRFSFPSHGIDVAARNPEIEINGGASRAIFRLRGAAQTPYPDKRAALLSLPTSAPEPLGPPNTFGFAAPLRGTLTSDGQAVFAGFYPPPNDGFGCFSVSFSVAAP
ncbi:MAG TPA: HtaA domain-containing protein [Solirubrobacterales bacterium]|nr:HtaA domain-containing protein [Solirubrobacterales bacterium]